MISSRPSRPVMGGRFRALRGAVEPSGGERPPPPYCRSSGVKLRASPIPGTGHGWTAALTTTRRISTARWCGLGKRDGWVYERNQCLNAPQANPPARNLADIGWVAPRTLRRQPGGELLGRGHRRRNCAGPGSGARVAAGSETVVRTRRRLHAPRQPISRITRSTTERETSMPWECNTIYVFLAPRTLNNACD